MTGGGGNTGGTASPRTHWCQYCRRLAVDVRPVRVSTGTRAKCASCRKWATRKGQRPANVTGAP
jgi:hypothetical protein